MAAYSLSIVGVLVLCLVFIVARGSFRVVNRQGGALSGPVPPADDDNPLYRIDRVHMNAVEALTPFVVPAVTAIMVGVRPATLATLVWVYIAIRLIHIAVYCAAAMPSKVAASKPLSMFQGHA
jgi:uncharacterized MAPEG superfamily protein